jgi:hypothetical protein
LKGYCKGAAVSGQPVAGAGLIFQVDYLL